MAFPLRPREYNLVPGAFNLAYQRLTLPGGNLGGYPSLRNLNSIITKLRVWMRRASKRRLRTIREMNRMWNATLPADEQWNRVGLGRNNLTRGGPYAGIGGGSLSSPFGFLLFGEGEDDEGARARLIGNTDPGYLGRPLDTYPNYVWTKNQKARLV